MIDKIIFQFFVGWIAGVMDGINEKWTFRICMLFAVVIIIMLLAGKLSFEGEGLSFFWRIPLCVIAVFIGKHNYNKVFKPSFDKLKIKVKQ